MSAPAQKNPSPREAVAVAHKRIKLRKQHATEAKRIQDQYKVSEIASRVLAARGYKVGRSLETYLSPTLKEGLPDPSELKNLDKACNLIREIVEKGGSVAIACDFDVDGLSGGAQVYHFFKTIGVKVESFVPDRFTDGYGLNERIVREIAEKGHSLLITIDFGTTNLKELEIANELGIRTIVVDHHHVGETKSPADVFINPQQKGCGFADKVLSAAGLAWYLLLGLRKAIPQAETLDIRSYLDLACLGTICDMVPLTGANRVIAKKGLEYLTTTKRSGLIALKNVMGVHKAISCHDVSFGIGPRINAAGRMVHGEVVIDLLSTSDSDMASRLASRLNRLNTERQDTENLVKLRAIDMIEGRGFLEPGLVVWNKEFHTGVIGIVAQRLVEIFYRPAMVLGLDTDGIYKGSVRGVKGLSVVDVLSECKDILIKFGGHEGAGGLSVDADRIEELYERFVRVCSEHLKDFDFSPHAEADTEVSLDELSLDLINEISSFSPFGMGNPTPLLLTRGLKVVEVKDLKGAHMKVLLSDGSRFLTGMLWRQASHPALKHGASVDVAYKIDTNTFNGFTELQATIQAAERS